nr:MAG TPA: hypothetical protein [Caudoviricetes sp.]
MSNFIVYIARRYANTAVIALAMLAIRLIIVVFIVF